MTTARESPPTRRVIAVLDALSSNALSSNALSADPSSRPNLTTVARTAGVSPATCLGILNELDHAGYVRRHPDSTYGLGGALVALGTAARDGRPGLRQAREELRSLNQELGLVATVSAVVGEQIVVLDAAGESAGDFPAVGSGTVFPFVAPVGLMFAAWSPDDVVDAWLSRSPVDIDPSKLARLRDLVGAARTDGHLVERLTNVERKLHDYLAPGAGLAPDQAIHQTLSLALSIFVDRNYAPGELEAAGSGSVSVVAAPCFGPGGTPELYIGVYVMREDVPSAEVDAIARQVRESCARVTATMGGSDPWTERESRGAR